MHVPCHSRTRFVMTKSLRSRSASAADWPNADERPELQTLHAHFSRRIVLFVIYFAWVCVLMMFLCMWIFTGGVLLHALVAWDLAVVPSLVRLFLLGILLYESYYVITPGDRTWMGLRHLFRNTLHQYPYFRHNACIFEEDADDKSKQEERFVPAKDSAMFAFHPHGMLSCGFAVNGVQHMRFSKADVRWLVSESLFWFPLLRDMLYWLEFDNVNKATFERLMRDGNNVALLPGGFEDATLYQRYKHRIYLKKRFGFIKLALQHGYKVYPAYSFGEERTYHTFTYFQRFRLQLNTWKIPGVAFFGSIYCPIMPQSDVDLITVVGKPLKCPLIAKPTADEVLKYQTFYVDALRALFDRNKAKYAEDPNATLEIF